CDLCWIQRIFIYSLTLILGMAIFRKEEKFSLDLTVLFSGVGGVIAFYHYFFVQLGSSDSFICLPGSTNCSDILVSGFGYITIPLMALTIFSFLFIFSLVKKYKTLH
ncbi:MAG: disulfide bond formation protein B, partial [Candidatus Paceibacterota bacterium]